MPKDFFPPPNILIVIVWMQEVMLTRIIAITLCINQSNAKEIGQCVTTSNILHHVINSIITIIPSSLRWGFTYAYDIIEPFNGCLSGDMCAVYTDKLSRPSHK